MSTIPSHFRLQFQPKANVAAVVTAGQARFSLLASRLIRMEYDLHGRFQDRPSQPFWFRNQPLPPFTQKLRNQELTLETEHLQLIYDTSQPFSPSSLAIRLHDTGTVWRYGDVNHGDLQGTTRTLDRISGSTKLEPGLLSRDGWAVVDDSTTLVFDERGWLTPRVSDQETKDLYFFGYGRDYNACLRDYFALTGPVPLLPRWALGNWWSRFWAYDAEELQALMAEFKENQVPLAVCIIDMDWHLVDVGPGINGWTGYTWNRELFPDPPQFLRWLHDQGLKTALNLHPALGIRRHEQQYSRLAARLGRDPQSTETINFAIADPQFANAYLEELHHPHEADGVDFWWMDWQQGELSDMPGLDPLWLLNHLHFLDLGRDGVKRPFIFSRWGGLGNHRYPIGFSGDTHVDWPTLQFQPHFTATAANVGFGWWSHDIGGHYFGIEERELYTRWVQYGVFSPIFRLHSTNNPFHERRPWGYDAEVLRITRDAMQLRHALIPYLYALSWRYNQIGEAPIRPIYHDYPDEEEAYRCPQQYTFGPHLIAAPFTTSTDPDTGMSAQQVWLPEGEWTQFFTGERFSGGRWVTQYGRLHEIPLFARAGAIVPLGPKVGWGGVENPAELTYHIFTGGAGQFDLFEDDGQTMAFQKGGFGTTTISQEWTDDRGTIEISAVAGDWSHIPAERSVDLHLYGFSRLPALEATIDGQPVALQVTLDTVRERLTVRGIIMTPQQNCIVKVEMDSSFRAVRDRRAEHLHTALWSFRLETAVKEELGQKAAQFISDADQLRRYAPQLSQAQLTQLMIICTT